MVAKKTVLSTPPRRHGEPLDTGVLSTAAQRGESTLQNSVLSTGAQRGENTLQNSVLSTGARRGESTLQNSVLSTGARRGENTLQNSVISTGAQRSGETCGLERQQSPATHSPTTLSTTRGKQRRTQAGMTDFAHHQPRTPFVRAIHAGALSLLLCLLTLPSGAATKPGQHAVTGAHVMQLTQQLLNAAPKRYIGSPGHLAAENFIKAHFAPEMAKGNVVADTFTASTPIGLLPMTNYIVKFPGSKDGIIALVSHYETNYPLKDIGFVGANDGACTTALLIALGEYFRAHPPDGYSVWLVFDDGEEAIRSWTASDSLYGTRHLAAKWSGDGTASKIKAVLIADMIGDKDLNIMEETRSTEWLRQGLYTAAKNTGHVAHVFGTQGAEEDDHTPFLARGIPTIDIIDPDYGPHTADAPDGYHHTAQDTVDKISAASLQISADLFLELIRLINAH